MFQGLSDPLARNEGMNKKTATIMYQGMYTRTAAKLAGLRALGYRA